MMKIEMEVRKAKSEKIFKMAYYMIVELFSAKCDFIVVVAIPSPAGSWGPGGFFFKIFMFYLIMF